MKTISANDLKTKGISAIGHAQEALITVRGEAQYVILSIKQYETLRVSELEFAIAETKKEIAEGRFITESIDDHIKRVTE